MIADRFFTPLLLIGSRNSLLFVGDFIMSSKRISGCFGWMDEWMNGRWHEHGISPNCFYNAVSRLRKRACQMIIPGISEPRRLWAWHSFDSLWVLIKPINGGFRSGIPVSMLPESGFLETRISMFLYRRSVTTVSKLPEEIRNQQ